MTRITTEIELLCDHNRYIIDYKLTYGMSKKEVLVMMGNRGYKGDGYCVSIDQPVKIETFRRDGSEYEVYYYIIRSDPFPSPSSPRELGKVIFMGDKYVGDHRRMTRKCVKPPPGDQLILGFDDRYDRINGEIIRNKIIW